MAHSHRSAFPEISSRAVSRVEIAAQRNVRKFGSSASSFSRKMANENVYENETGPWSLAKIVLPTIIVPSLGFEDSFSELISPRFGSR